MFIQGFQLKILYLIFIFSSGTAGADYLLVKTYPGVSKGAVTISPDSNGISGITNFVLTLALWSTSNLETLFFDIYYYNYVSYTSQGIEFKSFLF